jgi:modification methylase
MQSKRAAPKVPFGSLVEAAGWRRARADRQEAPLAGHRARRWQLAVGEDTGSIHGMGTKVQNAASCNGWTFWHYQDKGE